MKELTQKQKQFVHKMIELGNQTKAYRAVYKGCKNDSSACSIASDTLRKPNVAAYYSKLLQEKEDAEIATADEVLKYFTGVMRGNIKDQFNLDASLQDRTEAAKQLSKRMGLDKQVEKITGDGEIVFEFKRSR